MPSLVEISQLVLEKKTKNKNCLQMDKQIEEQRRSEKFDNSKI